MSSLTVVQPRLTSLRVVPSAGQASVLAVRRRTVSVVMSQQRGPRGPKGDEGPVATPTLFEVLTPAATWTIPHPFAHRPIADVYDESGQRVIANVHVDLVHIVVEFPTPTTGFVLAF